MLLSNPDGLFLCLFILLGALLATCLHEWGHAIVAYWGGDRTVKSKGYLTLNPLKYTDVSTSLVLPIMFLIMGGFALPGGAVYINTHLLRGQAWKSAVSAAGPAATALVAIALSIPFQLSSKVDAHSWFWPALAFLAQIEVAVLILNLLPIPALDGYGILEPWLPEKMQQQLRSVKKYGFLFLLAMFWTSPTFSRWFWGLSVGIAQRLGIPRDLSALGYAEFMGYRWLLLLGLVGWAILHKKLSRPKTADSPQAQAEAQALRRELNQQRLSQQPDNYGALIDQGNLLMREQQYNQAVEHYSLALEHYPKDARFLKDRGFAYARQKNFEAALADYDQALQLSPKDRDTLHVKADALLMLERYNESLAAFDQALRFYPSFDHLWYDRGLVLQKLGRDRDALASYEKALKIDPKEDSHWAAVIDLQQELGHLEASERLLQRGLKQHPKSLRLWQFKLNRALAAKDYETVLSLCDSYEQLTAQNDALVAVGRSIALGALQRFSEARLAIDQAMEREPGSSWILRNRIQLLSSMKCYDEARADLAVLLATAPENRKLLEQEASLLIATEQYDEAIALYDRLLATDEASKDDAGPKDTNSKTAEANADVPETSTSQETSTATPPGQRRPQVRWRLNKGLALFRLEQYAAALDCYGQALAIAPQDPHGLANRGAVLLKLGHQKEGLADLDQAVFLEPDNAQLWEIRGDALYDLEQWERALASYDQGLEIAVDLELLCDRARCYVALDNPSAAKAALQEAKILDASTTDRIITEKPSLAELWQSIQNTATASGKPTAS